MVAKSRRIRRKSGQTHLRKTFFAQVERLEERALFAGLTVDLVDDTANADTIEPAWISITIDTPYTGSAYYAAGYSFATDPGTAMNSPIGGNSDFQSPEFENADHLPDSYPISQTSFNVYLYPVTWEPGDDAVETLNVVFWTNGPQGLYESDVITFYIEGNGIAQSSPSDAVVADPPCNCGASPSGSTNDVNDQTGNNIVMPPAATGGRSLNSAQRASGSGLGQYGPRYSTSEFRPVPITVDIPFATQSLTPDSIEANGVFYDPTGVSAGELFRVGELLDPTLYPAGRHDWDMEVTEHYASDPDFTYPIYGHTLFAGPSNALMSPGWSIPGIDRLTVTADGALWQSNGDKLIWFTEDGGDYLAPDGEQDGSSLFDNLDGTFTLINRWGDYQTLNALGLVTEKVNRDGRITTFTYTDADSDSDSDDILEVELFDGRTLSYGYTSGLISSITDFDGREILIGYDVNDQLETITFPDPDDAGPLDALVSTYTYETGTSYIASVDDGGYVTEFTYNFAGAVIARENPDETVEEFQDVLTVGVVDPGSGLGTIGDPAPLVLVEEIYSIRKDQDDEETKRVLNQLGLPIQEIDALGNVTTYERDANGRVTLQTDPDPDGIGGEPAPETEYVYDASGNLVEMTLPNGGVRTWVYDSTWNIPTEYTDESGLLTIYDVNTTTGFVESERKVIGEIDDLINLEEDDVVTEYTYTAAPSGPTDPPAGLVETMTDALGRVTVYTHNARGQVTSVTYADGTADEATTHTYYNSDGTIDYELDELSRQTDYAYDFLGRLILKTLPDPDGASPLSRPEISFEYDTWNRLTKEIDPLDRETIFTYDERGRRTKIELPDHDSDTYLTTTTTAYNDVGQVESMTDPLGRVTSYVYDLLGRVTQTTLPDPDGAGGLDAPVTETEYDNLGRVISQTDALDQVTTYTFANFGLEVTTTLPDPDGAGTFYTSALQLYQEFDAAGNLIEAHDANGNTTFYEYDELNRLISVTSPDPDDGGPLTSMITTYEYDKVGNLRFVTDSVGNATEYVYDARNRQIEVIQPDPDGTGPLTSPSTEYVYDVAGQLVSVTDALDRVTAYDFDGLGRLILVTLPDPDGVGEASSPEISYTYDVAGRKLTMTDAPGKVTAYDYDLLDNLIELTAPDPDGGSPLTSPVTTWVYDAAGQLSEMTDPEGNTTAYEYDGLGRLLTLIQPDPDGTSPFNLLETTYTYDANGNTLTVSDPLSHVTEYAYDYLNRVSSVEDALAGMTSFTYDGNGNRLTLTDPDDNTTTWTYDKLNRVITEQNELAASRLFAYDQVGNLRMRTDRLDRVYVLSYDNLHRQTREDWWHIANFPTVSVAETMAGSKTNEVQLVGFSDSTPFSSGTFTLTYSGQTTSAIAWDADAATVDAALEALSNIGAGDVSVVKSTNLDTEQVWTVTFTGALAATNVAQITIDATSVYNGVGAPTELETTDTTGSTINEEQTVTLSGATAGYYRLLLNGYYTAPIAYNASAGSVETALEALTNIDNVTVTGSAGGPYTITFGGTQSGINVSTLNWRPADTDPLANSDFVGSLLYEYDAAGQLTDAFYQDGSLEGIAGNFFTFDGLGRVTNETMMIGGYDDTITLDQQYDADGNRTQALWSFGTTEQFTTDYTYDALNRLTELTRSSDEQADFWHRAQFSYNKLGQFLGISRFVGDDTTPIGVADTDFAYDDLNRLVSIEHFTGGTTWAGYDYTYDDASRITSIDSYLDGLSEYTHDDTNQLTSADHTGSTDETYTYDANGNRTMSGYSTGDNNQLTSDGVYNYTYDAEGNRLTRTNISTGYVTEYTWDHRNRLTKVTEKDDMDNVLSTVEHSYDAFNRWIRRSADADGPGGSDPVETIFAYDGNQVSLEFTDNDGVDLDGEDLSHVYTWGPAVDQLLVDFTDGDVPQWALTDHLGTVRDFVKYDAGMTDTVDTGHRIFDSFGNVTSQTGISSLIRYTGRPFDETTGLQNNLNRWLDTTTSAWLSEDPISFAGKDTNLRRYVGNSPLWYSDSVGLAATGIKESHSLYFNITVSRRHSKLRPIGHFDFAMDFVVTCTADGYKVTEKQGSASLTAKDDDPWVDIVKVTERLSVRPSTRKFANDSLEVSWGGIISEGDDGEKTGGKVGFWAFGFGGGIGGFIAGGTGTAPIGGIGAIPASWVGAATGAGFGFAVGGPIGSGVAWAFDHRFSATISANYSVYADEKGDIVIERSIDKKVKLETYYTQNTRIEWND